MTHHITTRWHHPLLWVSAAMAILAVVSAIGLFVDPRELVGAPAWAKPLKFALSIAIYCLTLSWLIGLLPRWKRVGWWLGTLTAGFLVVEIVVIVAAVVSNTTSHFNVSSPFHVFVWNVMAASIVIVWMAAIPVIIVLMRSDLGDRARTIAIRAGFVIALVGMALAFFMTGPSADQLANYQGIAGAHSVGVADGGPGLPFLGWSTVAGDLRVPHFIGMHALQILPLFAFTLERVSNVIPLLKQQKLRAKLTWILAAAYTATLAVLTAQALLGESVVRPSAPIAIATLVVGVGGIVATVFAVNNARRAEREILSTNQARL